MSLAWNSQSIDPAAAKSDLLVVLLEGIHASAVEALRHAGYTRIVTHSKSLAGIELRAALAEASFLGKRWPRKSEHGDKWKRCDINPG